MTSPLRESVSAGGPIRCREPIIHVKSARSNVAVTVCLSETAALATPKEFPQGADFVEKAPANLPVRRSAATFTPTSKRTDIPGFG